MKNKIDKKTEKELIKHLAEISTNLSKPLDQIDESYLDQMIEIFTTTLSGCYPEHQTQLVENLIAVKESSNERKLNQALIAMGKIYKDNTSINENILNKNRKHIKNLKDREIYNDHIIKNFSLEKEFDQKDFMNFLSAIISKKKNNKKFKLSDIRTDIKIDESTHTKFSSYFDKKLMERVKVKQTKKLELEVPELTETFLRAIAAKGMINTFQAKELKEEIKVKNLNTVVNENFNTKEISEIKKIVNILNSRYKKNRC